MLSRQGTLQQQGSPRFAPALGRPGTILNTPPQGSVPNPSIDQYIDPQLLASQPSQNANQMQMISEQHPSTADLNTTSTTTTIPEAGAGDNITTNPSDILNNTETKEQEEDIKANPNDNNLNNDNNNNISNPDDEKKSVQITNDQELNKIQIAPPQSQYAHVTSSMGLLLQPIKEDHTEDTRPSFKTFTTAPKFKIQTSVRYSFKQQYKRKRSRGKSRRGRQEEEEEEYAYDDEVPFYDIWHRPELNYEREEKNDDAKQEILMTYEQLGMDNFIDLMYVVTILFFFCFLLLLHSEKRCDYEQNQVGGGA